jgi:hypothetical protein
MWKTLGGFSAELSRFGRILPLIIAQIDCGATRLPILRRPYFDEPASKLRKLHDSLDALVLKAYGWSAKDDVLANLLNLNLELAELEAVGQAIVGPGCKRQLAVGLASEN